MAVRALLTVVLVAVCAVVLASSGTAITGGAYDGNNHPYVGLVDDGGFACSGTLLSPTVMLTAAHCFTPADSTFGTNSDTGALIVRVSFDPDLIDIPREQRVWHFGSYYPDPDFQLGAGPGLLGFATHDLALIIFSSTGCSVPSGQNGSCGPIPSGATLGQYGQLPAAGAVDRLRSKAAIDIVGFGLQNFARGGGPCGGKCKPRPGDAFTRFASKTTLVASEDQIADSFIKLQSNRGGVCFGDSGGPDLPAGTRTVVAVNSFGPNAVCTGPSYSYRIDTPAALAWIASAAHAHGGAL